MSAAARARSNRSLSSATSSARAASSGTVYPPSFPAHALQSRLEARKAEEGLVARGLGVLGSDHGDAHEVEVAGEAHVEVPVVQNPDEFTVEAVDHRPCVPPDADRAGDGRAAHHEELGGAELPTVGPDDLSPAIVGGEHDFGVGIEDGSVRALGHLLEEDGEVAGEVDIVVIEDAEVATPGPAVSLVDGLGLADVVGQFDQLDGEHVGHPGDRIGNRWTAVIDEDDLELGTVGRLGDHAGQRRRHVSRPTGGAHEDREHGGRSHRLFLIIEDAIGAMRPLPLRRRLFSWSVALSPARRPHRCSHARGIGRRPGSRAARAMVRSHAVPIRGRGPGRALNRLEPKQT